MAVVLASLPASGPCFRRQRALAWWVLTLLWTLFTVAASGSTPRVSSPAALAAVARSVSAGFRFETNCGQADPETRFLLRGARRVVHITSTGMLLRLAGPEGSPVRPIRVRLAGADPRPSIRGMQPLPGRLNYLYGRDRSAWRTGVTAFGQVRCDGIYPGVDLSYHPSVELSAELEYDFIVAPGADARRIRLEISGADSVRLDAGGDLVLSTAAGEIRQRRPRVYQQVAGIRRVVDGRYVIGSKRPGSTARSGAVWPVRFALGGYDRTAPLVIDPVISYSSFFGGSGEDAGLAVTAVPGGGFLVAGTTLSGDFQMSTGRIRRRGFGGTDGFVSQFAPSAGGGGSLLYTSFIGGSGDDECTGVGADGAGNVYLTGQTTSRNFLRTHGNSVVRGGSDAFLASLTPDGSRLRFSALIGGQREEFSNALSVDSAGNCFLAGTTLSSDLAEISGFQGGSHGGIDAFVGRYHFDNPGITGYLTHLGGSENDFAYAIAADGEGGAYVTGETFSPDFPVKAAVQPAHAGGDSDVFLARIDANQRGAASLLSSTYLGGDGEEAGLGIAVDEFGNAYVAGQTSSEAGTFPISTDALQPSAQGDADAFLTVMSPGGSAVLYSSFYGGSGVDEAGGLALRPSGQVFIGGTTDSPDLPGADRARRGGGTDGFVTAISLPRGPTGASLEPPRVRYALYLGGSGDERVTGTAVGADGNPCVTGASSTRNGTFPLVRQFMASNPDGAGGFVSVVSSARPDAPTALTAQLADAVRAPSIVNLAWQHHSTIEFGFAVERRPDADGHDLFAVIGTTGDHVFTDFDAPLGRVCTYRVAALGSEDPSPYSNQATVTTPPVAPGEFQAQAGTSGRQVHLDWSHPARAGESFQIERRPGPGGAPGFALLATVPTRIFAYDDDTVAPTTTYVYRLRAVNAGGASPYSPEVQVTTGVLTYSISGRILFRPYSGQGTPLPPVPIADAEITAAGLTAASAVDGGYVLSGLPAGTYTLGPVREGFRFNTRTVTLGSRDATDVDFDGTRDGPSPEFIVSSPHDVLSNGGHQPSGEYPARVPVHAVLTGRPRTTWTAEIDGRRVGRGTVPASGEARIDLLPSVAEGLHELRLVARDPLGELAEERVLFRNDASGPRLELYFPAAGTTTSTPMQIRGSVADQSDLRDSGHWDLFIDGRVVLENQTAEGPNALLTLKDLSPGRHTLRLDAVDNTGNRSSLTRPVTVTPATTADNGRAGLVLVEPGTGQVIVNRPGFISIRLHPSGLAEPVTVLRLTNRGRTPVSVDSSESRFLLRSNTIAPGETAEVIYWVGAGSAPPGTYGRYTRLSITGDPSLPVVELSLSIVVD